MQYNAIPCNTMQYHAIPCNTMQYHAIPCNTMQFNAIPCYTMQYHASLKTADRAYHCPVGSIMAIFIIRSLCLFCAFEVQKPLGEKILSWWILGVNVLMAILCPPCSPSAEHHEVFSFSEMHSFCRLLKISLIQSPALLLTRRALWAPSSRDVAFVNNFPRLFLVIPAFTALPIS